MKFFGTPYMVVNERKRIPFSDGETKLTTLFRFDNHGEFTTDNEKLIKKLKRKFRYEEVEEKKFKCKHCDYETENRGLLLAHYRQHKQDK